MPFFYDFHALTGLYICLSVSLYVPFGIGFIWVDILRHTKTIVQYHFTTNAPLMQGIKTLFSSNFRYIHHYFPYITDSMYCLSGSQI